MPSWASANAGVEGHDLFGVGVGLLRGQPELAVERLLADPYDQRAGVRDLLGQSARGFGRAPRPAPRG